MLHFDKTKDFAEVLMAFRRKPPQGNVRWVRTNGKNIYGAITNKTGRTVQYEPFNEFQLILMLDGIHQHCHLCPTEPGADGVYHPGRKQSGP